jgi:glycosyltransferase involved in cell wall biosynthesis
MKKISCIIPAYNEERGIESTLSAVVPLLGNRIYEVIVVDDSSIDRTKDIVQTFPSVFLLAHETNQGKSRSVADGIRAANGEYIFLLDADLKFLNTENILALIDPIEKSIVEMTISYRKNAWPLFPFKHIDYLSGERVFPRSLVSTHLDTMEALPSYGLEIFLNRIIIKNKIPLSVIQWPNVENVFNQEKHGFLRGWKIVVGIWWNVLCTASIFEIYSQNLQLKKLLVR